MAMLQEEKKDPFDGEYIGNIFGWKLSLWGLVVILLMVGLMWYRHRQLGIPFGQTEPTQEIRGQE